MKTLIWYGATAVFVGMAAAISGQTEIRNGSSSSSSYIQTSKLVGRKVKSSDGTEIGVVKDVVIDRSNGCMAYTVVSTGGAGTDFISGGGKLVAIPWAVYSPTSDLSVLMVNVSREKISHAESFEYTRMDEYARPDFVNNIYSYYGVKPGSAYGRRTGNGCNRNSGSDCQSRRSGFAGCRWNRLAEQKTFSAYARFFRGEFLWGFSRESFNREVSFGKHNQSKRKIATQSH